MFWSATKIQRLITPIAEANPKRGAIAPVRLSYIAGPGLKPNFSVIFHDIAENYTDVPSTGVQLHPSRRPRTARMYTKENPNVLFCSEGWQAFADFANTYNVDVYTTKLLASGELEVPVPSSEIALGNLNEHRVSAGAFVAAGLRLATFARFGELPKRR